MAAKVVSFVVLFAISSSKVLISRKCDPERARETPTLCSNYRNIVQLDKIQTKLQERQMRLEEKIAAMEAVFATLNVHKAEVDEFTKETDGKLNHVNKQLDQQQAQIEILINNTAGFKSSLGRAEEKVAELNKLKLQVNKIQTDVNTKVAFSATVTESRGAFTGPGDHRNILIFDGVFTNFGDAYNSKTGIFTAPVKGLYHFSFVTFGYSSHPSGAILVKNGHYRVSAWEPTGGDSSDTTGNTVILQLRPGDTVGILLWNGGKIHTSVFSGFLLFPTP